MLVQPKYFFTMAALLLAIVLNACGADVEAATNSLPAATMIPTLTSYRTVANVSISEITRPRVVEVASTPTSARLEQAITVILQPRAEATPIIKRAPSQPPATPAPAPVFLPAKTPAPTPVPTLEPVVQQTVQPIVDLEPASTVQPPTATAVPPTATAVPPTATVILPTATAIPAPEAQDVIVLTGAGSSNSDVFWSPTRLPWLFEWDAIGTGPQNKVVTLMDPDGDIEVLEIVSDSGSGQLGGLAWIYGNMGMFYVRVEGFEGAEDRWTIWISPQ